MGYFDELIRVDGTFSPVYNAKGMVYDKMEDYGASYVEFSRAIELDRTNSVFYHNRGCCLKNMEKYE
jgi:lipoprotein NlpI